MSHNHMRSECRHGFIFAQCRCIGANKTVTIVDCAEVHEEFRVNISQAEGLYSLDGLTIRDLNNILSGLNEIYDRYSYDTREIKDLKDSISAGMKLIK